MTEDMQCYIPGDLNIYSLIPIFYFYKLEHLGLLSSCLNLDPRAGSFWLRFRIREYTKSFPSSRDQAIPSICISTHTPIPTYLFAELLHPITPRKVRLPEFPFRRAMKTGQSATNSRAWPRTPRNQPNPRKSLHVALVGAE